MNAHLTRRVGAVVATLALLTGCSNASADPSPTPTDTSPTPSASSTEPAIQAVNAALDVSTVAMMSGGITEFYEVDGTPYYTAVFDPTFKGNYHGAGIMSESDQVDLMLELDAYSLYQLARAVANSPFEATTRDGEAFLVTIDSNRKGLQGFPAFMRVSLGPDGRVASIEYPAERQPNFVRLSYTVDQFGKDLLARANGEKTP